MRHDGVYKGRIDRIGHRSVLTEFSTHIPLSGMDFTGDNGEAMIYLMASCPGLFNRDTQHIAFDVNEGAHLFLTDTSATELHPSGNFDPSVQDIQFHLKPNSVLEYIPDPIIPFKDSNFKGKTSVYMEKGSQAFVTDIVAAGRVGRHELFEYLGYHNSFEVYWDHELHVSDTIHLDPKSILTRQGVLGDHTHFGTLWILSERITSEHLNYVQQTLPELCEKEHCYGGVTSLEKNGLAVRLVGYSSETIQNIMKQYWSYFRKELLMLEPLEVLK